MRRHHQCPRGRGASGPDGHGPGQDGHVLLDRAPRPRAHPVAPRRAGAPTGQVLRLPGRHREGVRDLPRRGGCLRLGPDPGATRPPGALCAGHLRHRDHRRGPPCACRLLPQDRRPPAAAPAPGLHRHAPPRRRPGLEPRLRRHRVQPRPAVGYRARLPGRRRLPPRRGQLGHPRRQALQGRLRGGRARPRREHPNYERPGSGRLQGVGDRPDPGLCHLGGPRLRPGRAYRRPGDRGCHARRGASPDHSRGFSTARSRPS